MPVNKNAMLRYQILDKCLSNRGRRWTWVDLLNAVNNELIENDPNNKGIGKTTLFEDLKDLEFRVFKADIEKYKEGRTSYLRYSDPNFSINNQPLSNTEANQLKSAIQVLSRFNGNPQFDWIHEVIPAIESKLGLVSMERSVMSFESNPDYEGLPFITPIFNGIINKRVLEVIYQDFRSEFPYSIILHPYYLKQFNSRWYVFGRNEGRKRIETFALDRIKEISERKEEYIDDQTNWDDYFSDFIGVTRGDGEPIEIKLHIKDERQAAYIRTNPLHQTQKQIKKVEDGFETSIKVIPNFELEKLILSFGENIRIISPDSFRERISQRANEIFIVYFGQHLKNGGDKDQ